jgi:hypothetical protein
MDTLSFFRWVLPESGVKVLAELVAIPGKQQSGWRYHAFDSVEDMAQAVAKLDAQRRTLYHACNSFGGWYEEEVRGKLKRRIRTQKNVVACRSLYDDIDVGKPGCYATQKEAAGEVLKFCKDVGLSVPMIVSSGRGLHLYWSFDADITPDEWRDLARLKRAAIDAWGLKADPAINLDEARVLRPVGSTWRKDNANSRPVVVKHIPGARGVAADARRVLVSYINASGAGGDGPGPADGVVGGAFDGAGRPSFAGLTVSTDLSAVEYPPSSLGQVAQHCAQVRAVRDTQGDVNYEHWRGVIGLAKYATEGLPIAIQWSARRGETGHTQTDTGARFDTWSTGPTTCEFFRACNPSGCEECPHEVKTPLSLGYTANTQAPTITIEPPQQVPYPATDGPTAPSEAPTPVAAGSSFELKHWPENYRMIGDDIAAFAPDPKDPDGPGGWQRFARPLFYPVERICLEDGTYGLRMMMLAKEGRALREFRIPTKVISDSKSMRMAFGAYEITVLNPNLAMRYMNDYLASLRKATEERYTFQQFGWREDMRGFLIGDKLISAESITPVEVGNSIAHELRKCGDATGSAQQWIDGVDTLYNRKNGEPYQYTICTAFGSVVAPLMGYEEWNGIPLALTSSESGFGKSTVAKIAVNALSNSSLTTPRDITPYALLKRASTMKNLCVLFDEITNNVQVQRDRAGLMDVLYALSNGRGRIRLGSDGAEKRSDPAWCLMSILTGNRNLFFNLSESKTNPEAAQMRVFEIDMHTYPRLDSMLYSAGELHAQHQEIAQGIASDCNGVFAVEYIRYVLAHMGEVRAQLRAVFSKITRALGGQSSKERFYAYHVACTLVGGLIAQKLGYHRFNMGDLRRWAMAHILRMRGEAAKYNLTTEDQFSAMLADLHGTIIVTKMFDALNTRSGKVEIPLLQVRSPISGRLVLGSELERGKLFLTCRAVDDWCRTHSINPGQFRTKLETAGLLRKASDADGRYDRRVILSRGVPSIPTGQTRCLEFEFAACQGYMDEYVPIPQEATDAQAA